MRLDIVLVLGHGPRVARTAGILSFGFIGACLAFGAVGFVRTGVLPDGAVRCGDAHLVDASPFEFSAVLRHSSRAIPPTGWGWYRRHRRCHHHHASLVFSRLTTSSYDHPEGAWLGIQLVKVCLESMAPEEDRVGMLRDERDEDQS